jgi:hypothetical protein
MNRICYAFLKQICYYSFTYFSYFYKKVLLVISCFLEKKQEIKACASQAKAFFSKEKSFFFF